MQLSSGFFVIVFCALLLVGVPCAVVIARLWRWRGVYRVAAVCCVALIVWLGTLAFPGRNLPAGFEESALFFLALWGIVFWTVAGVAASVVAVLHIWRRLLEPPPARVRTRRAGTRHIDV